MTFSIRLIRWWTQSGEHFWFRIEPVRVQKWLDVLATGEAARRQSGKFKRTFKSYLQKQTTKQQLRRLQAQGPGWSQCAELGQPYLEV